VCPSGRGADQNLLFESVRVRNRNDPFSDATSKGESVVEQAANANVDDDAAGSLRAEDRVGTSRDTGADIAGKGVIGWNYCRFMATKEEAERVLRSYAQAWLASDLEQVLAAYHDDIELHYMRTSPLAGTHRGRDAAFAALGQASVRTSRKLVDVKDVMVGDALVALLSIEDLGDPPRRVQRVLLYRVQVEKLRECWLFDEDQRFIDQLWSKEP